MSLVRFSYSENPVEDLNNKIRHIYDLNRLLKNKTIREFFTSKDFDELLLKVANDDVLSFKNDNEWLQNHPTQAVIFKESNEMWNKLKTTYLTTFSKLVYGELPNDKDILETLNSIKERMENINLKIK